MFNSYQKKELLEKNLLNEVFDNFGGYKLG